MDKTKNNFRPNLVLALGIISCLIGEKKCIYLSTPITNGKRLLNWYQNNLQDSPKDTSNYQNNHLKYVINPNCNDGKKFATYLRETTSSFVLDPSCLQIDNWSQSDYLELWDKIIEKFAEEVRFNDGWEYSNGCVHELILAKRYGIPTKNRLGFPISVDEAIMSLTASISRLKEVGINTQKIEASLSEIIQLKYHCESSMYKDQVLDSLASTANIAQFVSFSPELEQRFSCVFGFEQNHLFSSTLEAITALLQASPEKSVNVRSFRPDQPQGNEFHYGLINPQDALAHVKRLAGIGFYTIVNETVDINDGGVSGVLQGGCMEFAPGVVPRFVEKDSAEPIPALPRVLAMNMLRTVYGFNPALDYPEGFRVEFSIHPKPRGWRNTHTIIWEEERVSEVPIHPFFTWPNKFSLLLGDKAYGLLLASLLDVFVPRTTVFARNKHIGIFTFGDPTGAGKYWTRTCPRVQEPGHFSTIRGWNDPFGLMDSEDPHNQALASCLVQEEVSSIFSGGLITDANNKIIIEGVVGFGDRYMLGDAKPVKLPQFILNDIQDVYIKLSKTLGATRFEWAHDGHTAWILQLHMGITSSSGRIIYPGKPDNWIDFNVKDGLSLLRTLIGFIKKTNKGIRVHGHVGMSSHIADLLRKAKIPSILVDTTNKFKNKKIFFPVGNFNL